MDKNKAEKALWFAALGFALIGLAGFVELLHALAIGLILGAVGELIGE
jgi:hypothetical protein